MNSMFDGRAALVLASSAGIGRGIATELCAQGATVMLFGRDEARLIAAQAHVERKTGQKPAFFVGDVTRRGDVEDAVKKTCDTLGPIFTLVNNCGGPKAGPFDKLADEDWQSAFELTLLSYVRSCRAAIPVMREHGGGRILNVTSTSTKRAIENLVLSNVFRLGVLGLTKTLAMEMGHANILVNTVGPGAIQTDRADQLDTQRAQKAGLTLEQVRANNAKNIPLGRYGQPEEFAKLSVFLCSPVNTYVTGQNILIDGAAVPAY